MRAVQFLLVCGLVTVAAAIGQCERDGSCAEEKGLFGSDTEVLLQGRVTSHDTESEATELDSELMTWAKKQMDEIAPPSEWSKEERCETKPSFCSFYLNELDCRSDKGAYWKVPDTPAKTYCHWEPQLGACISKATWCEVMSWLPSKGEAKSRCSSDHSVLSNVYGKLTHGMKKQENAKAKHVCQWTRGKDTCPQALCQQICARGKAMCGANACNFFGKCFKDLTVEYTPEAAQNGMGYISYNLNMCFKKIQGICESENALIEEEATVNRSETVSRLVDKDSTLDEALTTKKTCR